MSPVSMFCHVKELTCPAFLSDMDHMNMGMLQELEDEQKEGDDSKAKHQERYCLCVYPDFVVIYYC